MLLRLDPVLDQFYQHPVGAEAAGLRQGANLCCDVGWEADASPYRLV